MSNYFIQGKGWRYDFTLKGKRYTKAGFKTKTMAKQAEMKRREEILNPKPEKEMPIDMTFLDLVNLKLEHVKAYNSNEHYRAYFYLAKRWSKEWGCLMCNEISSDMLQEHLSQRRKVSAYTANKDLRYLRATFNYGIQKKIIASNPTQTFEFFPVEKKIKYVPTNEDIDKVIAVADADTQDYLWTIRETMARISEINQLLWEDINFKRRFVVLYTRKKRGGHRTPRKIGMTNQLFQVLKNRYENRDPKKPWIFWHRYWSRKNKCFIDGPYDDRKKLMKGLCEKAGVRYFRFHAIRHSGASTMDSNNVPIGSIQKILGHENRKTTEIYLHSMDEMEREAIAIFEEARKSSHTVSHTN